MRPYIGVQCVKIVVEYEAVIVVGHCLYLGIANVCTQKYTNYYTPVHNPRVVSCILHAWIFKPGLFILPN